MYHQTLKYLLLSFVFLFFVNPIHAESTCPLAFPSQNLCASLEWTQGPSADEESAFEIKLWNRESGSSQGPYQDPLGELGSFSRMTCCGSISFISLTKTGIGQFQASKVLFVPGTFDVFVQLKHHEITEQRSVRIELND